MPRATSRREHWTDTLFVAFGLLCALVFASLAAGVVFGAVSFLAFLGFCLASAISFLAAAGAKGSLMIGTTAQQIVGSLSGVVLVGGCLWFVHWLAVEIVIIHWRIAGELWIALSALVGFTGAIKPQTR
jgi:hypothetical protein